MWREKIVSFFPVFFLIIWDNDVPDSYESHAASCYCPGGIFLNLTSGNGDKRDTKEGISCKDGAGWSLGTWVYHKYIIGANEKTRRNQNKPAQNNRNRVEGKKKKQDPTDWFNVFH